MTILGRTASASDRADLASPISASAALERVMIKFHSFRRVALLSLIAAVIIIAWGSRRTATPPAAGRALNGMPATQPAGAVLRVGTYNIHGGRSQQGRLSLDLTAANLHDLDIIGLNEVHGAGLLVPNQAMSLGGKLGMDWVFAPSEYRWWHEDFGNGVLSRIPVQSWMRQPLPCTQTRGFRNVVILRVPVGQQLVNILITHLDREVDGRTQRQLVRELFLSTAEPAVLMGDLNAANTDPEIRALRSSPGVCDVLGDQLPGHVDWIFARGLKCLSAGFADNGASDHPAAWAQLQVNP